MTGFVLLHLACIAAPAQAQEGSSADQAVLKDWIGFYTEQAALFQMFVGAEREELQLHPRPVLQWTNPVRDNQQHGAVYVWTLEGRPEVIGSIWSSLPPENRTQRTVSNEFHSLSAKSITSQHPPRVSKRGPIPDWSVDGPGIELKPHSDAPPPADSAALRLIQLRRVAQQFKATTRESKSEAAQPLRLLTQPVFRYQSPKRSIVDGAIFAFALGTDPEMFLVIEARDPGDGPQWQYAPVRFSNRGLSLRLGEREVFQCGFSQPYVGTNPYFVYWRAVTYPADFQPGRK